MFLFGLGCSLWCLRFLVVVISVSEGVFLFGSGCLSLCSRFLVVVISVSEDVVVRFCSVWVVCHGVHDFW